MEKKQVFVDLTSKELREINAGEKTILYWIGRFCGELVKTHQENPGFGDALVMAMHYIL